MAGSPLANAPHPESGALPGRVALVTGGARRLGGAISRGLALAGADVAVNYLASADEAQAVVEAIQGMGRRGAAIQADVSQVEACRRLVDATLTQFGRLDILVHAASPFEPRRFADVTEEVWDRAVDTTLKGAFFVTQRAAPELTARRGAVVFISDVAARRPFPSFIPHSAAKGGLETLTLALARTLAPHVRVNAIAPGVVLPPEQWTEDTRRRAADRTLVGRLGTPDDVVRTVLFLLTSPFITGQIVAVDGGEKIQ